MITRNGSNRRSFMKYLVASPLLAQITAKDISAKSLAAVGLALVVMIPAIPTTMSAC